MRLAQRQWLVLNGGYMIEVTTAQKLLLLREFVTRSDNLARLKGLPLRVRISISLRSNACNRFERSPK